MTLRDPSGPRGPLSALTVIDLSRVLSGPYCSLLLADLGARVIKVEPPGAGDDSRSFAPMVNGQSAYFAAVNRGKESIALDLKNAGDRAIFERLLDGADVLLENFRPGVLARLGFPAALLEERWPRLVHASISGFGQEGPLAGRAAYDLMIQAMGGLMSITGEEDGGPVRIGTSVVDITSGMFAAIGILAALQSRAVDGRGRSVDIAMLDCTVALLEHALARVQAGDTPRRLGARFPTIAPSDAYRTSDGWIVIGAVTEAQWLSLTRLLGLPGLASESQFSSVRDRVANQALLKRWIEQVTVGQSTAHWDAALSAAGVACGPVRTPAELLADPQLTARGMLVEACGVKVAGNPVRISGFSGAAAAAPELDGSRAALLAEFL